MSDTPAPDQTVKDQIAKTVNDHDVVLYMKGTPTFPQCGFSSTVVQVFDYLGVDYSSVNVLEDPAVRQGIKDINNWPTIPQVFVKGEFIGGCDIVREMFESGELRTLLADKGVEMAA
ncbi:Grx4 family monothiol glutaredoxin [uncultured Algimonas sp.]|uniref:Grx4 family monothiol glutaredoxin n=1 Tax=uncultured Algimonas sp. TaxID=1547920 RepID=UPI00261E3829|nr:Grx4 family monothiol glutaredoxin [uncultured Algimonas sp.]